MRDHLKSLTTLRFLAAAAIVVHHTAWYFGYGSHLEHHYPLMLGVSFFFVLSGFVLTYAHPSIDSVRESIHFIGARIGRIWPAHITMLLVVILFLPYPWNAVQTCPDSAPPFLVNGLLLQSWIPLPCSFYSFNGVSWSISTEMFFYVMFPLLLWRWNSTKWLKLALAAALAAICVNYATRAGLPVLSDKNTVSIDGYVYIFPPARLLEFTMGMLAADLWTRYRAALDKAWLATALQAIALLLVIFGIPKIDYLYRAFSARGYYGTATTEWLSTSGYSPLFLFFIISMGLSRGLFARLLSFGWMVTLGEISFSVYMTHQVLLRTLMLTHNLSPLPMLQQCAIYWALVLGISYLLWRYVEQPCRRLVVEKLRQRFSKTASKPSAL